MAMIHLFSLGRFAAWDASWSTLPLQVLRNPAEKRQYPRGSLNHGSVCYLNSVLQALFHLPLVRKVCFAASPRARV